MNVTYHFISEHLVHQIWTSRDWYKDFVKCFKKNWVLRILMWLQQMDFKYPTRKFKISFETVDGLSPLYIRLMKKSNNEILVNLQWIHCRLSPALLASTLFNINCESLYPIHFVLMKNNISSITWIARLYKICCFEVVNFSIFDYENEWYE